MGAGGPRACGGGSEQSERAVVSAAHHLVVQGDAADPAVLGQNPRLRLDLLGGKDALNMRQPRLTVQQLEVPGELFYAVDLAAALDLDGDARPESVPAHDVYRPD